MSLLSGDLLVDPQLSFNEEDFWLNDTDSSASVEAPFADPAGDDLAARLERIEEQRRKVAENLLDTVQETLPLDYGQLTAVPEGADKVLRSDEAKPSVLFGIAQAESVAGSIGHKILEIFGIDRSGVHGYIAERYRHAPVIHKRWAERVAEVAPIVMAPMEAPKGKGQVFIYEAPIRLRKKEAIAAVQEINDGLVAEQQGGDGRRGPFELAIGASPRLTHRGRASGQYSKALAQIDPDAPMQPKDVRRLTRQARTHHLTRRGNMLVCPVSRPDVLDFRYNEADLEARNAAVAIKTVFDANIGFDAEKLAKLPVTFMTTNSRTGEDEQITTDGLSVVNWAAGLMCQGKLECHIVDYKFQTHSGDTWEKMQWLWDSDEYDGDITQIVTEEHLASTDKEKFGELQQHWREYERDLARTSYSVLSFFKYGVREFRAMNKSEIGYPVSWTKLRNNLHAYILGIDFDISEAGEGLEPDERNADGILPYITSPPLMTLGVPKNVGTVLREVPQRVLRRDIERRGPELRKMARAAGRVVLHSSAA